MSQDGIEFLLAHGGADEFIELKTREWETHDRQVVALSHTDQPSTAANRRRLAGLPVLRPNRRSLLSMCPTERAGPREFGDVLKSRPGSPVRMDPAPDRKTLQVATAAP